MIINYLLVENFKSFKEKTHFDLEVKDHEKNIVLIQALNGVGKTSFLEATRAAFFGLSKSEFEKYLSYGQEVMTIEVEFYNTSDYKTYKISREYSLNQNDTVLNENLKIYIDDEYVKDFNEEKLRLFLQTEFPKEISQFFFFDGEKIQEIIDYNNPREIKAAIEKVLGIENLKQLKDILTEVRSTKIQKYGTQQTDKQAKTYNLRLKDLLKKRETKKEEMKESKDSLELLSKQIRSIKNDRESLLTSGLSEDKLQLWDKYKKKLIDLEKNKSVYVSKLESFINDNIDDFLLKEPLKEATPRIKSKYTQKHEMNYDTLKSFAQSLFKPSCTHCGNEYDPISFAKVEEKLKQEITEYNESLNTTESSLNVGDFTVYSQVLLSKESHDPIDTINKIESIDLDILNIQREINSIEREGEVDNQLNKLQTLEEKKDELTERKIKTEDRIDQLTEDLTFLEENISQLEFQLESLIKKAEVEKIEKDFINVSGNILSALNEYIDSLVIEKKEKLREKTEEMFQLLSNTEKYQRVQIADDYKVDLLDKNDRVQEELSKGFKQILMTSLIWGLKECSEKDFPVIVDTPLARLDPIHRENMLTKFFTSASAQVIILSQPSEITSQDLKDETWTKFLKDGEYIQMNEDTALDSTVIKSISI